VQTIRENKSISLPFPCVCTRRRDKIGTGWNSSRSLLFYFIIHLSIPASIAINVRINAYRSAPAAETYKRKSRRRCLRRDDGDALFFNSDRCGTRARSKSAAPSDTRIQNVSYNNNNNNNNSTSTGNEQVSVAKHQMYL
jgi:hypothetical protein